MFVENSLVWRTAVLAYEEAVDAVRGVRDDPFERREVAANVGLDPRLQAKFDSPHLRLHFLYRSLRLAIGLRIMRRGVLEHGVVWPIACTAAKAGSPSPLRIIRVFPVASMLFVVFLMIRLSPQPLQVTRCENACLVHRSRPISIVRLLSSVSFSPVCA